jgi:hypothetical protein
MVGDITPPALSTATPSGKLRPVNGSFARTFVTER